MSPPKLTVVRDPKPLFNDLIFALAKDVGEDCAARHMGGATALDLLQHYLREFRRESMEGDSPEQTARLVCCAMWLEKLLVAERADAARKAAKSFERVNGFLATAIDVIREVRDAIDAEATDDAKPQDSKKKRRAKRQRKVLPKRLRKAAKAVAPRRA